MIDYKKIILEWFSKLEKGYAFPPYTPFEKAILHDVLISNGLKLDELNSNKALDMEKIIVDAAGGLEFTSMLIPNSKEVGKKIINTLGLKGEAYFPKNSYPVTQLWNSFFPAGAKRGTLTPKTDFIIGDKKISLKVGNSQLMSGGKNEALATFYAASERVKDELDSSILSLQNYLNDLIGSIDLSKLGIKGNKTELQKTGKFVKIEILKKAQETHEQFKEKLRKIFNTNEDFKKSFVFEAMSGISKFGKNSMAVPNYILITDYMGNAKLHEIFSFNSNYVAMISKLVVPDVRFKTDAIKKKGKKTGYYRFWSTVGLEVKSIVDEAIEKSDELLLEDGMFDIKQFLKNITDKISNFFKTIWDEIKNYLQKSWKNLIDYMEYDINISFNNYPF